MAQILRKHSRGSSTHPGMREQESLLAELHHQRNRGVAVSAAVSAARGRGRGRGRSAMVVAIYGMSRSVIGGGKHIGEELVCKVL